MSVELVLLSDQEDVRNREIELDEKGKELSFSLPKNESLKEFNLEFSVIEFSSTTLISDLPGKNILVDGVPLIKNEQGFDWPATVSTIIIDFGRLVILSSITLNTTENSVTSQANLFISENQAWLPVPTQMQLSNGTEGSLPLVKASKIMLTPYIDPITGTGAQAPAPTLSISSISAKAHYLPNDISILQNDQEHFSWPHLLTPQSVIQTEDISSSLEQHPEEERRYDFKITSNTLGKIKFTNYTIETLTSIQCEPDHALLAEHTIGFDKNTLGSIQLAPQSEIKSISLKHKTELQQEKIIGSASHNDLSSPLHAGKSVSYSQQIKTPDKALTGLDIYFEVEEKIKGQIRFFGGSATEPENREFKALAIDFNVEAKDEAYWHHFNFEEPIRIDSKYIWIGFFLDEGKCTLYHSNNEVQNLGPFRYKPVGSSWISGTEPDIDSSIEIRVYQVAAQPAPFDFYAKRGNASEKLIPVEKKPGQLEISKNSLKVLNGYSTDSLSIELHSTAHGKSTIESCSTVILAGEAPLPGNGSEDVPTDIAGMSSSMISGIGTKKQEFYAEKGIDIGSNLQGMADVNLDDAEGKLSKSAFNQLEEYQLIAETILKNRIKHPMPDKVQGLSLYEFINDDDEDLIAIIGDKSVFDEVMMKVEEILLYITQKQSREITIGDLITDA